MATAATPAAAKLPLKMRQEIRDAEPEITKHLAAIAEALGVDKVALDVDHLAIMNAVTDRKGDVGRGIPAYLEALADNLKSKCKDDMVKEAIKEVMSANKITFRIDAACKSYNDIVFEKGVLVIVIKPGEFWTNTAHVGRDIEEKL